MSSNFKIKGGCTLFLAQNQFSFYLFSHGFTPTAPILILKRQSGISSSSKFNLIKYDFIFKNLFEHSAHHHSSHSGFHWLCLSSETGYQF
jgi:hypothetical protein